MSTVEEDRTIRDIAGIIAHQTDQAALDSHHRSVLARSLAMLRRRRPEIELIVSCRLAAGPAAHLTVHDRREGADVVLWMDDDGSSRTISRWTADAENARLLRALSGTADTRTDVEESGS